MMPSRLTRTEYGSGHTYALDGKRVPGVTTIIRQATPAGGLMSWYGKQAASWALTHHAEADSLGEAEWLKLAGTAGDRARDEAAERGRAVHAAADALIDGEPVEVAPEILGRARLVVDFLEAWDAEVLARECVVYHAEHKYAGTFDLLADLSDGRRWLLDYKTGSGVYPDVTLQLAGYRYASHIVHDGQDIPMPKVDRCGVVWVRESSWELLPVAADPAAFQTFLACRPVYHWNGTKRGRDSIGAPLPKPDKAA